MGAKVTGEKMTEAEQRGDKTWYCQNCGGELEQQQSADPTGRLKCSRDGTSWWATLPPSADEVEERMAAIKRDKERVDAAHKAAKR